MTFADWKFLNVTNRGLAVALALTSVAMLATPSVAIAKNDNATKGGNGQVKQEPSSRQQTSDDVSDVIARSIIDSSSRALIEDYFRKNPQPVSALPPGIAKNVARGKPLPPGIAKKSIPGPLQRDLRDSGSSVGKIVDALIVGDDVALVDAATGVVVDILKDVVRSQ